MAPENGKMSPEATAKKVISRNAAAPDLRGSNLSDRCVRIPKAGLLSERSAARLKIIHSSGKPNISAAFKPCSSVSVPPLLRR